MQSSTYDEILRKLHPIDAERLRTLFPCTKSFTNTRDGLREAISRAGNQKTLARICGLRQQAVSFWVHRGAGAIPAEYLDTVCLVLKMTPRQIRPDLGWTVSNSWHPQTVSPVIDAT